MSDPMPEASFPSENSEHAVSPTMAHLAAAVGQPAGTTTPRCYRRRRDAAAGTPIPTDGVPCRRCRVPARVRRVRRSRVSMLQSHSGREHVRMVPDLQHPALAIARHA